jgi:hypothetical protein
MAVRSGIGLGRLVASTGARSCAWVGTRQAQGELLQRLKVVVTVKFSLLSFSSRELHLDPWISCAPCCLSIL